MLYLFTLLVLGIIGAIKLVMFLRNKLRVSPVLYYKQTELSDYLLQNCKSLNKPFQPPRWLLNNHMQTILPAAMNMFLTHGVKFKRELIEVDDGERVALDWAEMAGDSSHESGKDIIIILPGMTASAKSFTNTCKAAIEGGFRVGVLNKRGHGNSKLTKPKLRGFGDSVDVHNVLQVLKERHPEDKIAIIGSSAGSALVGSYCLKYKDEEALIDACIHLSPGYIVKQLITNPPFSRFYQYIFVQSLKNEIILPNMHTLKEVVDLKKVHSSKSILELEEHVYVKSNGYKDLDEYWLHNDLSGVWESYSIPTLCISALDDPICVKENIPFDKFKTYGHGMLMTTAKGGHCGFIEDFSGMHWSDEVMVDYIHTVFEFLREGDSDIKFTI